MTRLRDAIRREKAREAADTRLSESSELLIDITDKLKRAELELERRSAQLAGLNATTNVQRDELARRETQLAKLNDVAGAAKDLLLAYDGDALKSLPERHHITRAAQHLRTALAATAEGKP